MSVPGEQPSFYAGRVEPTPTQPMSQTQPLSQTQPMPQGQFGQVQPYGMPPGGNAPVPYGYQPAYPPQGNPNAAAIAILGRKSGGLAAILSLLLVGAGQMYCGHVGRGLAFLGAAILSYMLMFVFIGFMLVPIVFIWALVDAVTLAGRHNVELARRLSLGGPTYY